MQSSGCLSRFKYSNQPGLHYVRSGVTVNQELPVQWRWQVGISVMVLAGLFAQNIFPLHLISMEQVVFFLIKNSAASPSLGCKSN